MPAAISCIYISYALSVRNLRLFSFYSFAITENSRFPQAMDRIFGAPEIIVLIFQDCDSFRDVFALAAACQYLHSVWCTNSTSIIWPLARTEILGFDQALVAVWLEATHVEP